MNSNQTISMATIVVSIFFVIIIGVMRRQEYIRDEEISFSIGAIFGSVLTAGLYGVVIAFFGK